MVTDSLPVIPHPARIQADARTIADGIRQHLTYIEREPIAVYGRCLLHNVTPTDGLTLRFWHRLHLLSYKLPEYRVAVAHLSTNLDTLHTLQDEIARCIANNGSQHAPQ